VRVVYRLFVVCFQNILGVDFNHVVSYSFSQTWGYTRNPRPRPLAAVMTRCSYHRNHLNAPKLCKSCTGVNVRKGVTATEIL